MINLLVLQGRLTKDFTNKNGNAYSCLAVDTYKGDTMFIDIAVFGKSAEYCFNYLTKGSSVLVEGSLNINEYQDKKYITCIVKTIQCIYGAKSEPKEQTESPIAKSQPTSDLDNSGSVDISDDDLPF